MFCTFWLGNVLRAAGSAPAALASLLFDPPEPQIIGKTVFRDFPTFSRICILFLLTLSLLRFSLLIFLFPLTLSISAPHLSILSEVWLLNFLRLYIIYIYILLQYNVILIQCSSPFPPIILHVDFGLNPPPKSPARGFGHHGFLDLNFLGISGSCSFDWL